MNDLKGIIKDCNKSDLVSNKVIKKIIEIIGQEEWQDLHDENSDICTTMGELIITLNGIEELEKDKQYFSDSLDKQIEATLKLDKENAELTRINDNLEKDRLTHIELEDKLKKENAELKEKQFTLRNERNTFLAQNEQYEKDLIDFNENLTRAKELLTKAIKNTWSIDYDVVDEINAFLNSEVEK